MGRRSTIATLLFVLLCVFPPCLGFGRASFLRSLASSEKHSKPVEELVTSQAFKEGKVCGGASIFIPRMKHFDEYSTAIQHAVTAMGAVEGGTVFLEDGIHFVDRPIQMMSNTCLIGMGSGRTFFKMRDRSWRFVVPGIFRVTKAKDVLLMGFSLDGNRRNQALPTQVPHGHDGIDVFVSERVSIVDVGIFDVEGNGGK